MALELGGDVGTGMKHVEVICLEVRAEVMGMACMNKAPVSQPLRLVLDSA